MAGGRVTGHYVEQVFPTEVELICLDCTLPDCDETSFYCKLLYEKRLARSVRNKERYQQKKEQTNGNTD